MQKGAQIGYASDNNRHTRHAKCKAHKVHDLTKILFFFFPESHHKGHHAGTDWYQSTMVKSQQQASRIIHSKGLFRGRGARTYKASPRITGTDWYQCTKARQTTNRYITSTKLIHVTQSTGQDENKSRTK
jgi:hypothetical protein